MPVGDGERPAQRWVDLSPWLTRFRPRDCLEGRLPAVSWRASNTPGYAMAVEITQYNDVGAFVADGGPFLLPREAENNLLIGMLGALREDAAWMTPSNAYLGMGREGATLRGVAMWTAGYRIVLSFPDD